MDSENLPLKRTAVFDEHVKLGGKIVPFAGWEMPVQFAGVIEEHMCVREKVGIFDVSHMGEVTVKGKDALAFVNYLVTNDVSGLVDGQVLYSPMLYDSAGIVDDLLVYRKSADDYLLVVNASNVAKDFKWMQDLQSRGKYDAELVNISDTISEFAVQGPLSEKTLQKIFKIELSGIGFFHFKECDLSGMPVLISRTGYTGEDGFEVYFKNEYAKVILKMILEAGHEFGIQPIGLGARDTLRFESKLMLYGNDITQDTNPLEAGLKWTVKFDKGDFCGKSELLKIQESGLTRRLVGFEMVERGIPRHDYKIVKDQKQIGYVTSGTFAPYLKKNLGLGYVSSEYKDKGTEIYIEIRDKAVKAVVVSTPFYKRKK
ncbi:MAG: glycine cleavage system aminomethyltransferase GcvT [bacterium]|nr:glycine cleavage system aminomethyltransferase GcvT [bacterium]